MVEPTQSIEPEHRRHIISYLLARAVVEVAAVIQGWVFQVLGGRDLSMPQHLGADDRLEPPRRAQRVTHHGLRGADVNLSDGYVAWRGVPCTGTHSAQNPTANTANGSKAYGLCI